MLRAPDITVGPFREANTIVVHATFMDNTGAAIPGFALETATLTLYSELDPYPIINSRDHVDILGSVDDDGELALTLTALDMAIIHGLPSEYHRALIEWTWNSGAGSGSYEVRIVVANLNLV